jgi:prepilin-type N-terminal cleavage/methylation domain-containing protein
MHAWRFRVERRLRRRAAERGGAEAGFTLIEVLISIALLSTVMTAFTTLFVSSVAITSGQRGKQMAIQLADDGIEKARSYDGALLATGRKTAAVSTQYKAPGVEKYMSVDQVAPATDDTNGAVELLPTAPESLTVNGVAYQRYFYLGRCYQARTDTTCTSTSAAGKDPYFRVVVALTWPEAQCAAALCSYVTSTLVSAQTSDPIYNQSEFLNPPIINTPTNQTSTVNVAITPLTLTATGGTAPLTWSVPSLPTGLAASLSGVISGTPTVVGNTTMPITVTDAVGRSSSASMVWTVNSGPAVTAPGAQSSTRGTAITPLTFAATGGTAPYTWQATNLPAGLSLDASTGTVSGTPTTAGAGSVTARVTDRYGATATATFTWTVTDILVITNATPEITTLAVSRTMNRTGGTGGVTWAATNLPPGVSFSSAGVFSGSHTAGTRFLTTVTVTDSRGATATATVEFDIQGLNNRPSYPKFDAPTGDQTTVRNSAVNLTVTASGGANYVFAAAGLPTGLTQDSATGAITGTPTVPGEYIVTLAVRNATDVRIATYMLRWTIT